MINQITFLPIQLAEIEANKSWRRNFRLTLREIKVNEKCGALNLEKG